MLGLWIAVALLPILAELNDLRLAYGLTGTPGTVTVESCREYGTGRSEGVDCRGTFRPAEAGATPTRNVHLPPESTQGESFPARLADGGGSAHPTGVQGRLSALTLPALGVLLLVPLPWVLRHMGNDRTLTRRELVTAGCVAAVPAGLVAIGLLASIF